MTAKVNPDTGKISGVTQGWSENIIRCRALGNKIRRKKGKWITKRISRKVSAEKIMKDTKVSKLDALNMLLVSYQSQTIRRSCNCSENHRKERAT